MKLSIVTSLYRSEPYVREFYDRIRVVAEEIADDCEFIFVNDGSPDAALSEALRLQERDERVVVVDLSRNFGHHRALMSGLAFTVGDLVFMLDVDLEEEPELLRAYYSEYQRTHADSVYGVQLQRKGKWFERYSGELFYRMFNLLTGYEAPKNTLIARLMTRRFVKSLLLHQERDIDIAGILHITGYLQTPLHVKKHAKLETTYTLRRKLVLALWSLTSFSRRPLIAIFFLGGAILLLTFFLIIYFLWAYLYLGTVPSGFTATILSIWFLGALCILSLGILALYLSVIFDEVKARPTAIIRAVYRSGAEHDEDAAPNAH